MTLRSYRSVIGGAVLQTCALGVCSSAIAGTVRAETREPLCFVITPAGDVTPAPRTLALTVRRALALIGSASPRVLLYDPILYQPRVRARLERLEAFVAENNRHIYLNQRGHALQDAVDGQPYGIYVLAAILAHEMAHLEGKDESNARRIEREWVLRFWHEGQIPFEITRSMLAHTRGSE
jgi:hypothetical protein